MPLQVLCADFDLENARGKLDEQGLRIAEHQEQSLKNRRKLAESTRGKFLHCSEKKFMAN
jgi:homeobox protein cut-like